MFVPSLQAQKHNKKYKGFVLEFYVMLVAKTQTEMYPFSLIL